MKLTILFTVLTIFTLCFPACQQAPAPKVEQAVAMPAKPDLAQVRAEIQALQTAFQTAFNARDAAALVNYYADDAVSLLNESPGLMGKAAIQKAYEQQFTTMPKGMTLAVETVDVFAEGDWIIETGKDVTKDATGKVLETGKFMNLYEKRNGKYLCIRDINNTDK